MLFPCYEYSYIHFFKYALKKKKRGIYFDGWSYWTQLSIPSMNSRDLHSCIGLPVAVPPSAVRSGHVLLRTIAYSSLTVTLFPLRTQFASPPCKDAGGVDNIEFLKGQSVTAVFNDEHPNSPAVIEGVVIKKGTETVYNLRFYDQSFRKGVPANDIKALSTGTRSVLSARSAPCSLPGTSPWGNLGSGMSTSRTPWPTSATRSNSTSTCILQREHAHRQDLVPARVSGDGRTRRARGHGAPQGTHGPKYARRPRCELHQRPRKRQGPESRDRYAPASFFFCVLFLPLILQTTEQGTRAMRASPSTTARRTTPSALWLRPRTAAPLRPRLWR